MPTSSRLLDHPLAPPPVVPVRARVEAVDLLRGLTIFAMIIVNNPGDWGHVFAPLLHAPWHGYTPTDLVFPFFLFIVGCSIAFAYRNKRPSARTYRKIGVRAAKLVALGIFLGAFTLTFPFFKEWSDVRLPGVLQRIGLVFLLTAPLALHFRWRALLGIAAALLVGYWVWVMYVPLPDGGVPTLERAPGNWTMIVDKAIFGTHTWQEDYDPEGLASTLPAVATCIIGVLIGRFLVSEQSNKWTTLLAIGGGMLGLGHLWHVEFPINKALWTSSFVLATAGWATLILAVIYYLQDVRGFAFGKLFKMMGANALILYFLSSFVAKLLYLIHLPDGTPLKGAIYESVFVHDWMAPRVSSFLFALSFTLLFAGLAVVLYRRRIFVKV